MIKVKDRSYEGIRTEFKIQRIEEMKPASSNIYYPEMKMKVDMSEKQVVDFIHEVANYFGDEWVKENLDLK